MDSGQMIAGNIERLIKERDTNNRAVAVAAGMSPTGVRDIITRKTKNPTFANLQKIAEVLDVDINEIIGSVAPSSPQILPPEQPGPDGAALIRVFDVSASAGAGMVVDEYEAIAANLAFPANYLSHITKTHPNRLAIISVTGGSMMPTLAHDDIVMVDTTKTNTAFDGIFVVRVDGLLKVKRVRKSANEGYVTLRSDNPQYPDEDVHVDDFVVVGRVVWMGTKAA